MTINKKPSRSESGPSVFQSPLSSSSPFVIAPPGPRSVAPSPASPLSQESSVAPVVEALRIQLEALGLDTRGNKQSLQQRLRKGKKRNDAPEVEASRRGADQVSSPVLSESQPAIAVTEDPIREQGMDVEKGAGHQPFDLYLVFDVEATCTEGCDWAYPNEIIEFPVVLVDGRTHRRVDEFHAYVRPSLHPTLSDFCKNLTGIKQETVDAADTFPVVLARFEAWLSKYAVHPFQNVVFVCDGPWDVRDFIRKQCEHSLINRPSYLVRFVDLRMLYVDFYQRERTNLSGMLNALGMEFQGREHSGQDDTRNIARIVEKMMQDGCKFVWNRECKLTRRRVAKSGRVLYTKADGPIPKGHSILF